MFTIYRLDDPKSEESRELNIWSYVLGALVGPVFVVGHGFVGLALVMLLTTIVIGVAAFAVLGLLLWLFDSSLATVVSCLLVAIVALAANGVAAVKLVRLGYIRRGWREGY